MKSLSEHILESFTPKEDTPTVVENLNENKEEVVNEEKTAEEKEKPSGDADGL